MTRIPFAAEVAEDTARCMADQLVSNCFAGVDADRRAELVAVFTPYVEQAIFAYWEWANHCWPLPEPSVN